MLGNAKSVLEQFDTKQSEYFGNVTR
jgi:hypothetical protein